MEEVGGGGGGGGGEEGGMNIPNFHDYAGRICIVVCFSYWSNLGKWSLFVRMEIYV